MTIAATLLASALACSAPQVPTPQSQPEWQMLFDGKSLDGWRKAGGKATYRVEDGAIVGTTQPKTPNTFLHTEREFGDFELELEFLVHPELNSGVQFRSQLNAKGTVHGYQCEIDPSKRAWSAGIYDERRRGWLNKLDKNEAARNAFKQGEWNKMRIRCIGPHLRTWINGVAAADFVDSLTPRGFIALQVHGVGKRKEPLEVRWRGIRLREFGAHEWRTDVPAWNVNRTTAQSPHQVLSRDDVKPGSTLRFRYQLDAKATLHGPFGDFELPPRKKDQEWRKLTLTRLGSRFVIHIDNRVKLDRQLSDRAATQLAINAPPGSNPLFEPLDRLVRAR